MATSSPLFPRWVDTLARLLGLLILGGLLYIVVLVAYAASPRAQAVGYQPVQPVAYSHAMHAGELGVDCRYCHHTVERTAKALVPPTRTCINCHHAIRAQSDLLKLVNESYATGLPLMWVRVHDLPDFVYFDHSAHVARGVGCASCHGRVDKMEVVYQAEPLNMGWCLGCHRAPEAHLRPQQYITTMDWQAGDQQELGARLKAANDVNPSTDCSTCHR